MIQISLGSWGHSYWVNFAHTNPGKMGSWKMSLGSKGEKKGRGSARNMALVGWGPEKFP